MFIEKKEIHTIFKIVEEGTGRRADITFIDMVFDECDYYGLNDIYNLEDWIFLNLLSARILELEMEYASKRPKLSEKDEFPF